MVEQAEEQVSFNFAGLQNIELARLRTEINTAFVASRYARCARSIVSLKATAAYMFGEQEKTKCKELEEAMFTLLMQTEGRESFNSSTKVNAVAAELKLIHKIIEYNDYVTNLLDQYGFMGGRKKDASKMIFKK